MIYLENNTLKIGILSLGAELRSVMNKQRNYEYMWQADASVWNRSSPVLFPFVGKLKNDEYEYQGKKYSLPQHGFARNFVFDVLEKSETKLILELKSNEDTLVNYPFDFSLILKYELLDDTLHLDYEVKNTGVGSMYFSIGAHPAFNLPGDLEDYKLEFELEEQFNRQLLEKGLRTLEIEQVPMQGNSLMLKKKFFEQDAIVLQDMRSSIINLKNKKEEKLISLESKDFPYYGIWAKHPFPFLCLEPWVGVADRMNASGLLEEKEGIIKLSSSEVFHRRITFRFF